jgi:Undecaprenyl-phosphate galactose phosphotransferase WbaP
MSTRGDQPRRKIIHEFTFMKLGFTMGAKTITAIPTTSSVPGSFSASSWKTSAAIVTADVIALSAIYWLAVLSRYLVSHGYQLSSYVRLFPTAGLFIVAFYIKGLYPGFLLHPAEEIRRVVYCIASVFVIIGAATFLWRNAEAYSRSVFLITWAAGAPLVLFGRYFVRKACAGKAWWGVPAIVLGSGTAARRVLRALQDGSQGVKVRGVFSEEQIFSWAHDFPPLLGDLASAPQAAGLRLAHYAIVAMPHKSNLELHRAIQNYCRGFRHVLLIPDMPGLCSLGISARDIGGEVGFEFSQRLFHRNAAVVKRLLDLAASSLLLGILFPLFLAIATLIKVTSKGSVLYRHSRYGKNGKTFSALKFRTMVTNGDQVLTNYLLNHPDQLFEWQRDQKLKNDPRITPLGKWLRRLSLDELPQLINVLVGQMSLVGPRPIVKAEIARYGSSGFDLYSRVLPGITGLWQVSGRNNTTYEERVAFDEYYVRNWSIWLDTYILFSTFKVLLTTEGAY